MTTRPTDSPLFATDPLFTTGSETGASVRLDPGTGVRGQGFLAESRAAARWINYELGVHGDWLVYLDGLAAHGAMQSWQRLPVAGLSGPTFGDFLCGLVPANAIGLTAPKVLFGAGYFGSAVQYGLSEDGSYFDFVSNSGASASAFTSMAADNQTSGGSTVFATVSGLSTMRYSANGGVSWATATPGFGSNLLNCYYAPGGHYLAASLISIVSATTIAGTYTNNVHGLGNCTPVQWADNGTAVVLLVNRNSDGHALAMVSADDGRTYGTPHDFGAVTASLTYSAAIGAFVVLDSGGVLYTSTDGAIWTTQKAALAGLSSAISPGYNRMAACGNAIAHLVSRNSGGTNPPFIRGIVYTFDLGATWQEVHFGDAQASTFGRFSQLISFNGRLVASDGSNVYKSGLLALPGVSFPGT